MTASRYRQHRGSETQTAVARWFAGHGWPFAEPVGAGRGGTDVTGMPGLLVEVKARRDLNLPEWLRQHTNSSVAGAMRLPLVVHRPDGYGPARVAEWPVTMRLDDFTALLHEAGYGTAPGTDLEDMRAERGRGRESLRPGLRGATARQAGYGTKED